MDNLTAPWPFFGDEEIKACERVLKSGKVNYWTGSEVKNFEKEFAEKIDAKYAVALTNGTVALDLALKSLGLEQGSHVIVPSRTFIATASAVANQGLYPIFADVDFNSGNITAKTITEVIDAATRAIVVVHLAGWPCDMDPIMKLAKKHNLKVIEDCAQAHGAVYKGRYCGTLGNVAAWSFCQDKIMTTGGEGGMITTNDKELWKKIWSYKDHGKDYDATNTPHTTGGFRWLHKSFGTNARMTEMQAAIGRVQLKKLPKWLSQRFLNVDALTHHLRRVPLLRVPVTPRHGLQAYYKLHIFIDPNKLADGWTRDRIIAVAKEQGIPCGSGICGEVYREAAFEAAKLQPQERLPIARELDETSLMFLVHPTLGVGHMIELADRMTEIFEEATK